MRFRRLVFLFLVILLFVFPQSIFAASFGLKTIGTVSVEGMTFSQFWYTSSNVTFTGTADANVSVTATIDGTSESVTADASENWIYSTTLSDGDHQVSFTSGGETTSFTLTIGQTVQADIGTPSAAATPTAGLVSPTIAILFLGTALIASGVFFLRKDFLRV